MATHDVPGANAANADELCMGCWAEHEDGSLVLVESTERNRVVFLVFDTTEDPVVEYRDMMVQDEFEQRFSWDPDDPDSIEWTWHDKTPFPWDRVIKQGAKSGVRYPSADDQLTAAARVARSLRLKGREISEEELQHLLERKVPKSMVKRLQAAIDELPVGSKQERKVTKHLKKIVKALDG